MKKQDKAIVVTPFYQALFVAGVIGGWILVTALLAQELASGYTNQGTWIFQSSTWVFPVLIFLASVGFAAKKYTLWLQRLFFGTMLASAALSMYEVVDWLDGYWYGHVYLQHHPFGNSVTYWQSFGNTWVVMAVSLVVYLGFLYWMKRKKV